MINQENTNSRDIKSEECILPDEFDREVKNFFDEHVKKFKKKKEDYEISCVYRGNSVYLKFEFSSRPGRYLGLLWASFEDAGDAFATFRMYAKFCGKKIEEKHPLTSKIFSESFTLKESCQI